MSSGAVTLRGRQAFHAIAVMATRLPVWSVVISASDASGSYPNGGLCGDCKESRRSHKHSKREGGFECVWEPTGSGRPLGMRSPLLNSAQIQRRATWRLVGVWFLAQAPPAMTKLINRSVQVYPEALAAASGTIDTTGRWKEISWPSPSQDTGALNMLDLHE